jgi:hypothetical protein
VPARGGYFQLQPDVQRGALALEQTIFLESLSTRAIFACGRPLAISTSVGALSEADSGDLFTEGRPPAKLRYSALSDVTPMDPARLWGREFAAPAAIRERYLQLPALDPRIAALARQVTRGRAHPYDQARALERFLRTSYGYSLELKGSPTTPDPLAAFLFDIRKGHCEYFASAMAIMLRQVGIPSRLVNGFRTGEYNRLGEAWVVRQYDAHSWVEAYFPPHGWVEFDPTPADPARVRSAFRKILLDLEDALDLWWSDEVVNYASGNQKKLFAAARERIVRAEAALGRLGSEFWRRSRTGFQVPDLRSLLDGARRHPGRLLIVPVALGLLAALSRLRPGWPGRALRDLRRLLGRHDPAASVTAFYADALALLERRGMARSPTQTPLEFAHSLAPAPFVPDLLALTEIYNRMRFGACSAAEDAARAARLLDALQTVLDLDRRSAKA